MTKIRTLSLALASLALAGSIIGCGCAFQTDCGVEDGKYPAYANKSGAAIKIVAIEEYHDNYERIYEKVIDDGDTLHYKGEECEAEEWFCLTRCGLILFGGCDRPVKMELHFLGESEKCLIFDGPIKHDGTDARSWSSYKKGKVIENQDFWADVEYVYTITTEHKAMAKESDCSLGMVEKKRSFRAPKLLTINY
jgi:hypothetical protein